MGNHRIDPGGSSDGTIWFAHWLRAASMTIVVIAHLFACFWAANATHTPFAHIAPMPDAISKISWRFAVEDMRPVLLVGSAAVGVFFLISGFLIPRTMENKSIGRFVFGRLSRIYPVWVSSLAIIAIVFAIHSAYTGVPLTISIHDWLMNALVIFDFTQTPYLNPVGWTLLIEVKFYILCVIGAATFGIRRAVPIALFVVVVTAFAIYGYGRLAGLAPINLHLWVASQVLAWSTKYLLMTLVGLCFYNHLRSGWSLRKLAAMCALLCAGMILCSIYVDDGNPAALQNNTGLMVGVLVFAAAYFLRDRLPANRIVAAIADHSYPLYTLHYVIGMALIQLFFHVLPIPFVDTVAALGVVVLLSWVVHRYVEVPATNFGKTARLTPRMRARV